MDSRAIVNEALNLVVEHCPRLLRACYWAGTACIALEELGHRDSLDLDFHTRTALLDVRPILAEVTAAFGDNFELIQPPDEFGSGFRGILTLPDGASISVEVLSNFEDVPARDLTSASSISGLSRVSLRRYLADKIQCIAEPNEARDLFDIAAVLRAHPEYAALARTIVAQQDSLMLAERLLKWSDDAIRRDLKPHPELDATQAIEGREHIKNLLKSGGAK